jgi:para-nitrobenzyl esterase
MQDQPGIGTDIYCREWHVDPDIEINDGEIDIGDLLGD